MTVSEKHRDIAEVCANKFRLIENACEGDLIEIVAAALAAAEREGMMRAEAICYARSKDHHKQSKKYEADGDELSQTQCLADAFEAMQCAADIRAQANTHSPDTPLSQADSAGSVPPPADPATHHASRNGRGEQ